MEAIGLCALGLTGGMFIASRLRGKAASSKWAVGGFQNKMDKKEALQVLGLREQLANTQRIKHAHRSIMLANHPDRGGSVGVYSLRGRTTLINLTAVPRQ